MSEPCSGWIDNFNGPAGLLTAAAQGILRAVYANEDAKSDYVPADIVIKGTLVAAWVRGTKKLEATDDIAVYNACVGEEQGMSLAEVRSMGIQVSPLVAFENTLRPCHIIYFKNKLLFKLYVLISHLLPAIAVDLVFRALGKKPKLVKVQRRTLMANMALEYFMVRPWHFINDKFVGLCTMLRPQDRKHFSFSMEGVKSLEQLSNTGLRIRKHLLHQDDKTLSKWRKIYEWEVIIDSTVTYIFYVCVFWWIINRFLKAYY